MNTAAAAYMGIPKEEPPHPPTPPLGASGMLQMAEFLQGTPYVLGEPPILSV